MTDETLKRVYADTTYWAVVEDYEATGAVNDRPEERFAAIASDFPECIANGATEDEALRELQARAESALEYLLWANDGMEYRMPSTQPATVAEALSRGFTVRPDDVIVKRRVLRSFVVFPSSPE
jgi:predicted RNase H-like HicB family nuclease